MLRNFKALPIVCKSSYNLQPEDGIMKAETLELQRFFNLKYILHNKVVLGSKFIYFIN
jgi:hypothetical protein